MKGRRYHGPTGTAATTAAPLPARSGPSPNRDNLSNLLDGVALAADNDGWAVGHWYDARFASYRTLAQRWDGTRWQVASTPNAGIGYNELNGVATPTPTDAWAVGWYYDAQRVGRPLITHWDGVRWSAVAAPAPSPYYSVLQAVSAAAPDDIWAQ